MAGKYILSSLFVLLCTFAAQAQQTNYKGNIDIVPVELSQRGDSLYVEMDIILTGVRVVSPLSVELTPRLASADRYLALPAVSVKGRNNYKSYERGRALDGYPADPFYETVKGYGRSDREIRYRCVVAYEAWMAESRLEVVHCDRGCGSYGLRGVSPLIAQVAVEAVPVPQSASAPLLPRLAYVTPAAEEVKSRELQTEVRLDFIVNKTDINPQYRNNPRELAEIRRIIDELYNDKSISVRSLEIVGYASPEGGLENNRRLSEGRATALRNYLSDYYDFPQSVYRITFGGENWAGLLKELETFEVSHKDEVLAVLRGTESSQERKVRLQTLRGGGPYRELLQGVYPGLRTAICRVDYTIAGFTTRDAVEVYRTRPRNLSLNEFYLVSQTFTPGSRDFIEVFETAVRMYPDDDIANLNAAVAALEYGNAESAERYLSRISSQTTLPEYLNARGVLLLLVGDREGAGVWFREASAGGLEAASYNNELLKDK